MVPSRCEGSFQSGFLQFVPMVSDPAIATGGPDGYLSSGGFTTCHPPACSTWGKTQQGPKTCTGITGMQTPGGFYPTYWSFQCTILCG